MMRDTQAEILSLLKGVQNIIVGEVYARVQSIPMLAHYTTIGAFKSILDANALWLSRSADMRDTSEVQEGLQMVRTAIDKLGPSMFKSFRYADTSAGQYLASLAPKLINETYILSLCEHGSDNRSDRLTMWKDFGAGGQGICMVLRKTATLGQTAKGLFPVHWCPIEYESDIELEQRVRHRLAHVERAFSVAPTHIVKALQPFTGAIISSFVIQIVVSHKNEHFYDDREVRFIRSDFFNENPPPADAVCREMDTPKGKRTRFVLPLRNYPEYGIDATLSSLLDHVIIGPSKDQQEIHNEVRHTLNVNGLSAVPIVYSKIPYRGDL